MLKEIVCVFAEISDNSGIELVGDERKAYGKRRERKCGGGRGGG